MNFSVNDKTAIVTGAATGVGLAIARHFAERGANVMFADSDIKALKVETTPHQANIAYFAGNLSDKLSRINLLKETVSTFDRVDILVNANRQVISRPDIVAKRRPDDLETMLEQNLRQHYELSWLVAEKFIEQEHNRSSSGHDSIGSIVNVSSIAAQRMVPELVEYSVSCAAQDQLTRSMAVALAPKNIRVNAVAFGSVMSKSLAAKLNAKKGHREFIEKATPLGRIAEADDVASVVLFLSSDSARFVTGQVLNVDGGRSLLDRSSSPYH